MRRPSPWEVHCSLLLVLSASALAVAACHDVAGPAEPGPDAATARTVIGAGPVVVTPEDMKGWSFVHDVRGTPCTMPDRCRLVDGPAAPPLGAGSVELASTTDLAASAMLGGHGGLRLDRVTALRYSTFRRTDGAPGDAAITLELDVEYDPTGPAVGDVGRIVFEPARAGAGAVARDRWQAWDARAGLWWSTRGAARAGDGPDGHPCVQSHPCSWATLLDRFPNIAIARDGGLSLTARRGPAPLRGNADSVVVGIDGANTTYDFEREAVPVFHVLAHEFGDGVIADRFPSDTLFRAGTTIDYALSSRPGREAPLVILDDTIVLPASGRLVMGAPHTLRAVSDTSYTYATLTPLERRFADLTTTLLAASDKVAVAESINALIVAEENAGTSGEQVARAVSVAQYVATDPKRDSAALDAVDAALGGRDFHYQYGGPGQLYTWTSRDWPAFVPPASATRIGATPVVGTRRAATEGGSGTSRAGLLPSGSATTERIAADNPENPPERTRIVYSNGIWTQRGEALSSATALAQLVYTQPRFANYMTAVTLHYNPTRTEEMKQFDAAHPCVAGFLAATSFLSLEARLLRYATCQGVRLATVITSADLVEAVTARFQLELALPPTNDAVVGLAHMIAAYRAGGSHVLLVGHSEGVIIQAAAVQQLPALERHPLQVAPRCVAVLALAPPTQRASYGMDEYHLKGLLAMQDIIRATGPAGWEDVDTPTSTQARQAMLARPVLAPYYAMSFGYRIHAVNDTYLKGNVAEVVKARLVTLHRECIPGSASVTLSSAVVPIQQAVTATLDVWNQNNRPLLGRPPQFAGTGYFFDQVDTTTFRAMAPYDGQIRVFGAVMSGLSPIGIVRIPLVRPDFAIRDTPLSEWVGIAAQNGSDGTHSYAVEGTPPADPWDGTPGTCTKQVRITGAWGAWADFERRCNHVYTPLFQKPDTLPTGRRITGASVHYTSASGVTDVGPSTSYYCAGEAPCITSGYVEWNGELGVVGRSFAVGPTVSTSMLGSMTGVRTRGAAQPPTPITRP